MKVDKSKWNYNALENVCQIQCGTRIVKKQTAPGEYNVYGGGDATFMTTEYNREDAILVARFALSRECTRFVSGKFFLNDSGLTLAPKDNSILFNFLKWQIFALNDTIYSLARGAAQKNLDMKRFSKLQISIPSYKEQKAIAAELDAVQEMIDGYKTQITDLDALAQSIFLDTFGDPIANPKGWDRVPLKSCAKLMSDGPFGSNLKSEHYQDSGIRVIRLQNIGCGDFIDIDKAYISPAHYETLKRYSCNPGDIVIGTMGEPNLRACIIPPHIKLSINKADCVHYIPKETLHTSEFVCAFLNSPNTLALCNSFIHGTTRARISAGRLANLKIFLPPMEFQQQFAAQIEAIEKQKELHRQQLSDAETLMAERMQYYFS